MLIGMSVSLDLPSGRQRESSLFLNATGAQTRSIGRHDQNQGDGAEDVQISMIDYKVRRASITCRP